MEFGDLSSNPFASTKATEPRSARKSFASALRTLSLVAFGLAAIVIIGSYAPAWLVQHLTKDFHSLDAEQKQVRLGQVVGGRDRPPRSGDCSGVATVN